MLWIWIISVCIDKGITMLVYKKTSELVQYQTLKPQSTFFPATLWSWCHDFCSDFGQESCFILKIIYFLYQPFQLLGYISIWRGELSTLFNDYSKPYQLVASQGNCTINQLLYFIKKCSQTQGPPPKKNKKYNNIAKLSPSFKSSWAWRLS